MLHESENKGHSVKNCFRAHGKPWDHRSRCSRSIQWSRSLERRMSWAEGCNGCFFHMVSDSGWKNLTQNLILAYFGYFGIIWTFSFCVYFRMDFLVSCHESQIKHIDFRKNMNNGRIAKSCASARELLGKVWRQWQTIKLLFWEGCSKALCAFVFNILYDFIISCFFNMTPRTQCSHKDATARKLQKHTLDSLDSDVSGTPPDRFNDCWCQSHCFNRWPHSLLSPYPTGPVEAININRVVRDLREGPVRFSNGDATWSHWMKAEMDWTIKKINKIAGWSFKRLETFRFGEVGRYGLTVVGDSCTTRAVAGSAEAVRLRLHGIAGN